MPDETTPPEGATTPPVAAPEEAPTVEEQTVPYERFQQVNKKAKENADRAKALEKDMADLRAQIEERESAGLPELERLKKDMERLQKRAEEAESKAAEADTRLARSQKERWVVAAASAQNFADPSDASAFVNLDDIEDEKDAERIVKRLATQKKHLLKADEVQLPGRVLKDGQRDEKTPQPDGIDPLADARILADGLKQFASR